jgi:hypothetical protein
MFFLLRSVIVFSLLPLSCCCRWSFSKFAGGPGLWHELLRHSRRCPPGAPSKWISPPPGYSRSWWTAGPLADSLFVASWSTSPYRAPLSSSDSDTTCLPCFNAVESTGPCTSAQSGAAPKDGYGMAFSQPRPSLQSKSPSS